MIFFITSVLFLSLEGIGLTRASVGSGSDTQKVSVRMVLLIWIMYGGARFGRCRMRFIWNFFTLDYPLSYFWETARHSLKT